jgi:hypothetical protein
LHIWKYKYTFEDETTEVSKIDEVEDEEPTEIFDKDFVNRLVEENKQLHEENYALKDSIQSIKKEVYDNTIKLKGKHTSSGASSTTTQESEEKQLTEYEQEYVKVHEAKVNHNELVKKLIDYYLGLNEEEKTQIISKTEKGYDYQKALIEKARDNMLKLAKRLNDADIGPNLSDIRFIGKIHSVYTEILYEELQLRKRNKEIMKE